MDIESIALLLEGYLLSLRRLSGNRCDFWSFTFDLEGALSECFKQYLEQHKPDGVVSNKGLVGYVELQNLLKHHLLDNLEGVSEKTLELFAWDVVEFIEMSYRDLEPECSPLRYKQVEAFDFISQSYGKGIYLVIPIKSRCLAVGLGKRSLEAM